MQSCSERGQARVRFGLAIAAHRLPQRSGVFAASFSGAAWLGDERWMVCSGGAQAQSCWGWKDQY